MRRFAISGLALALAVSGGCASPNRVRLDPDVDAGTTAVPAPGITTVPAPGTTTGVPPAGATTVVPAPATVVTPAPPVVIQTLRADLIDSPRVRAQTIYANRIEANEIRGVIHQDKGLRVGNTDGAIKGNEIVATVIYADEIKADLIIADHIYVRHLRPR
jgi:hypothetical protein